MRYNLREFTDTNSVICKIIVGTKASLVQRADFPVSGENVCEADKRGLGVAARKRRRRDCKVSIQDNPPVSFADSPLVRGGLFCAYNNFTNYAVSICKSQEIIPQDLLFQATVI